MKFESLANELIFQLFEYLNPAHLFLAFHSLNSRFDSLLFDPCQVYHVDFRSVSKHDFDLFCQQYLPLIINQVVSLHLSDNEETPSLPDHFLDYGFTLNKFPHLKSLTLYDLSFQTRNKLELDFHHLSNLTHLKITNPTYTHISSRRNPSDNLMNDIWSLPRLTHCYFSDMSYSGRLKVTSSSMKYLFIKLSVGSDPDLADIFKYTPHLQHFTSRNPTIDNSITMTPSITTLNISFANSLHAVHDVLRNLPHLSNLTLAMNNSDATFFDGHWWKQLIVDFLPNLRKFRFLVNTFLRNEFNMEKKFDEILNTFQTPFWLDEHCWFVQCGWSPQSKGSYICLHTLPYCFGDCYIRNLARQFKSTWPQDRSYQLYNYKYCVVSGKDIFHWSLSGDPFSPRIDHLTISLPISKDVRFATSIFDHLTSLEVSTSDKTYLPQLQRILDRAPHLYVLSLDHLLAPQVAQLNLTHPRIRRLIMYKYPFNGSECSLLASSALGRQCEILSIKLNDRRYILELLREMSNLRALTCDCADDKWGIDESLSSNQISITKWLEDQLPSTCSVSTNWKWQVRVWIDKK